MDHSRSRSRRWLRSSLGIALLSALILDGATPAGAVDDDAASETVEDSTAPASPEISEEVPAEAPYPTPTQPSPAEQSAQTPAPSTPDADTDTDAKTEAPEPSTDEGEGATALNAAGSVREKEPNDEIKTANTLKLGDTMLGTSKGKQRSDLDYFRFTVPEDGRTTMDFRFPQGKDTSAHELRVFNANHEMMYRFYLKGSNWDGKNLRDQGTFLGKGTYYMEVRLSSSSGYWGEQYSLKLTNKPGFVESELNDTIPSADELPLEKTIRGSTLNGSVNGGGDADHFRFTTQSRARVEIDFRFPSGGGERGYRLELLDADNNRIAHEYLRPSDWSGERVRKMNLTFPKGTNYVVVSQSAGDSLWGKEYSLKVTPKLPSVTAGTPKISGTAKVGSTLTAKPGTWKPASVKLAYEWQRNGKAIKGATKSTYKVAAADAGAKIRVKVTGSLSGYKSASKTSTAVVPLSDKVKRIAGPNRFATSAAISQASFRPGVSTAYITGGMDFPDALSGAPAAAAAGSPVPLIQDRSIPAEVKTELRRLAPKRIVVLGGNASSSVQKELRKYTSGSVKRLSGTDRFRTSAAISKSSFSTGVPVAYIANGMNFPDALSGAPAAGASGGPVLLTQSNALPTAITQELSRLKPKRIVVLGGTTAVNTRVQSQLAKFTSGKVTRIAGPDRFATSAAISKSQFKPGASVAYIANGMNFPDALSGAPAAGASNGPVLLVPGNSIPASVKDELNRLRPKRIVVLGGVTAVSASVERELGAYAGR